VILLQHEEGTESVTERRCLVISNYLMVHIPLRNAERTHEINEAHAFSVINKICHFHLLTTKLSN